MYPQHVYFEARNEKKMTLNDGVITFKFQNGAHLGSTIMDFFDFPTTSLNHKKKSQNEKRNTKIIIKT